ncbi:hypothetical protein [Salsuginibacillus kocurii]|uniref:hypothetical protein n=1 Tax=Salsuginibacillus kocurii TaxID=427078 RepID=UPI00035C25B3|nr:hypothetical protein [Salsuginibacillus kocurii]
MSCYVCKKDMESYMLSQYKLKQGGTVDICIECENTSEYYFDVIKRECLIDGESLELTASDEKLIKIEKKQRKELEEEQELLDADKGVFLFTNEPNKKPEYDGQVMQYINQFLGVEDESHLQRFRFTYPMKKHWHLEEWDGLSNVHIYLDSVKKSKYKAKKPEETEYKERIRKWYSGRFESDQDFYNATFGFSIDKDEPIDRVCVDYGFLCSKKHKVSRLIAGLLSDAGYDVADKVKS